VNYAMLTLLGLSGLAAILLVGRQHTFEGHGVRISSQPTSPLDEAERILAHRYAIGAITPEEYSRMLAILQR
jgi:uncharacterized membrane protein